MVDSNMIYNNRIWNEKCVEPNKRVHGNGSQWMIHRFPIKGGISIRDAIIYDMLIQSNPLLKFVKANA